MASTCLIKQKTVHWSLFGSVQMLLHPTHRQGHEANDIKSILIIMFVMIAMKLFYLQAHSLSETIIIGCLS